MVRIAFRISRLVGVEQWSQQPVVGTDRHHRCARGCSQVCRRVICAFKTPSSANLLVNPLCLQWERRTLYRHDNSACLTNFRAYVRVHSLRQQHIDFY
jgi:hypothetical protein